MIKTIILDYGKVLAYPISGNWFIPQNLFKIMGLKNTIKLLFKRKKINKAFITGNEYLKMNHKLFTEKEEYELFIQFYTIIFSELKMNVKEKIIHTLAQEIVYNDNKVNFYDDVIDGIKELKENYKIIIMSDTWPSLKRILDNYGILQLLDGLIMSCNYNATKETTKLFEIAINEYNLIPNECLFIDDSISNLKNSEKLGFIPLLMDRYKENKQAEYPAIESLGEIREIIKNRI